MTYNNRGSKKKNQKGMHAASRLAPRDPEDWKEAYQINIPSDARQSWGPDHESRSDGDRPFTPVQILCGIFNWGDSLFHCFRSLCRRKRGGRYTNVVPVSLLFFQVSEPRRNFVWNPVALLTDQKNSHYEITWVKWNEVRKWAVSISPICSRLWHFHSISRPPVVSK